jgi:hypothetical protein
MILVPLILFAIEISQNVHVVGITRKLQFPRCTRW